MCPDIALNCESTIPCPCSHKQTSKTFTFTQTLLEGWFIWTCFWSAQTNKNINRLWLGFSLFFFLIDYCNGPEQLTATFKYNPENKRNQNVTHENPGVSSFSLLSLFVLSSVQLQSEQRLRHSCYNIHGWRVWAIRGNNRHGSHTK